MWQHRRLWLSGWSVHQLHCGLHLWGGGSFLSEVDGDCTFIFQSSNRTTSPFSVALQRWGAYSPRRSHWGISDPFTTLMYHCSAMKADQGYLPCYGQARYRSKLGTGKIRNVLKQKALLALRVYHHFHVMLSFLNNFPFCTIELNAQSRGMSALSQHFSARVQKSSEALLFFKMSSVPHFF